MMSLGGFSRSFKRVGIGNGTEVVVDASTSEIAVLGTGAYGTVFCGLQGDGRPVAVKKMNHTFSNPDVARRTLRELRILRLLDHENIVELEDVYCCGSDSRSFHEVYACFGKMDADLDSVIRSGQRLSEHHQQFFMYQLCRALRYLKGRGVLHRDVKPRNILVNLDCDLRLADFGLARVACPPPPHLHAEGATTAHQQQMTPTHVPNSPSTSASIPAAAEAADHKPMTMQMQTPPGGASGSASSTLQAPSLVSSISFQTVPEENHPQQQQQQQREAEGGREATGGVLPVASPRAPPPPISPTHAPQAAADADADADRECMTSYIVTRWYRAPELLLQAGTYSYGVDVWAAGCVLAEMILGQPLFPGTSSSDQLDRILAVLGGLPASPSSNGTDSRFLRSCRNAAGVQTVMQAPAGTGLGAVLPSHVSPEALDLLSRMLEVNPYRRATVEDCLAHPWFDRVADPILDTEDAELVQRSGGSLFRQHGGWIQQGDGPSPLHQMEGETREQMLQRQTQLLLSGGEFAFEAFPSRSLSAGFFRREFLKEQKIWLEKHKENWMETMMALEAERDRDQDREGEEAETAAASTQVADMPPMSPPERQLSSSGDTDTDCREGQHGSSPNAGKGGSGSGDTRRLYSLTTIGSLEGDEEEEEQERGCDACSGVASSSA
uniref:Mitogen-activated protein kinase n=1 Tax=Chromera velia CCMP2878 TaxID=1169474 RepID=A0A0G4HMJ5_9ALVE|eukprot:Cvel_7503.t1-p1 / transcript=Cvel_7503.t1 / gene=Cvel_7503 / organism=Chromera_velia_CCMP2878 / gene_product=Mitogen-activated protein kinase 1, putative / transcript_product=Mitogen-activated protein kinase 1, putative / location=Cvel_scaffold394:22710-27141(-) / protein_length=666 / sequence_SO=supercontig / SO=protein_coding / is_pseudo=false